MSADGEGLTFTLDSFPASGRGSEVSYRQLAAEERSEFDAADLSEWNGILATGAVKVHVGKDAERIRRSHPDRIVTSRMVRRWKPQHSRPKAKSRW